MFLGAVGMLIKAIISEKVDFIEFYYTERREAYVIWNEINRKKVYLRSGIAVDSIWQVIYLSSWSFVVVHEKKKV